MWDSGLKTYIYTYIYIYIYFYHTTSNSNSKERDKSLFPYICHAANNAWSESKKFSRWLIRQLYFLYSIFLHFRISLKPVLFIGEPPSNHTIEESKLPLPLCSRVWDRNQSGSMCMFRIIKGTFSPFFRRPTFLTCFFAPHPSHLFLRPRLKSAPWDY